MKRNWQYGMAVLLSSCLVLAGIEGGRAYQAAPSSSPSPPQAATLSAVQLQQLVAPIALYPDRLIAQILAAATYPDQIVEAQNWMQKHKGLHGKQLAEEVNKQSWDPSVKAVTQFPVVLANMNQNLAWTSELGDAYVNEPQQLTEAIQTMRQRAMKAGNLKSTPQQKVETQGNTIVVEPAEPNVVYVPQYDPWLVYGYPLAAFPGWYPYPGLYWAGPGIGFGLGFGIGLFSGFGWGWNSWGYNWGGGGGVVYNNNTYISRSPEIVRRNQLHAAQTHHGIGSASRTFGGRPTAHAAARTHGATAHAAVGRHGAATRGSASRFAQTHRAAAMHAGAHRGYAARSSAFRAAPSFGGFHGGGFHTGGFGGFHGGGFGGFHGGGFHAGGFGGFHGGGFHGGGFHGGGHGGGRR
jgi:hypothetical protein